MTWNNVQQAVTVQQNQPSIATVYVPNQDSGSVSVVDIFLNGDAAKVIDIPVGGQPFAIDISLDGQLAFVTVTDREHGDAGILVVIDTILTL
jgi:YVTN family beta-propeller protein